MQPWNYFHNNGIEYISLPKWLDQGVDLAFSTRHGGVSSGVFNSLNMGLHVGDGDDAVIENRRRILEIFHSPLTNGVCCQQVHGHDVIRVNSNDRGKGAFKLGQVLADCDAMITNTPGVYLMSFYADCVPIYFWDHVHRVIGTAHGGWKGTMGGIAVNTLQSMSEEYGSSPSEVEVFIGPGIGPCCFEIQPDLAAKVNAEFKSLHDIITMDSGGAYTWDLQETNRQLLINSGVEPSRIYVCRLCTACHTDKFYSYRRENGETGRMGAIIGLRY